MGGIEMSATMVAPNSPVDKIESATTLGSVTSKNAVAMAEECPLMLYRSLHNHLNSPSVFLLQTTLIVIEHVMAWIVNLMEQSA